MKKIKIIDTSLF